MGDRNYEVEDGYYKIVLSTSTKISINKVKSLVLVKIVE